MNYKVVTTFHEVVPANESYWTADAITNFRTGSPLIGRGKTEVDAVACLLYMMTTPVDQRGVPLEINGVLWDDPFWHRR
jgi:hypothetical protein